MKEGRNERRKEGRKERRKEGMKEGRRETKQTNTLYIIHTFVIHYSWT